MQPTASHPCGQRALASRGACAVCVCTWHRSLGCDSTNIHSLRSTAMLVQDGCCSLLWGSLTDCALGKGGQGRVQCFRHAPSSSPLLPWPIHSLLQARTHCTWHVHRGHCVLNNKLISYCANKLISYCVLKKHRRVRVCCMSHRWCYVSLATSCAPRHMRSSACGAHGPVL